jgi:EpsI family protein
VFGVGAILTTGIDLQRALPLRIPLGQAIPLEVAGSVGRDLELSPEELRVAGVTTYLQRAYAVADTAPMAFSVYIGYYDAQVEGRTIHSPKNCLPGAGWEALASTTTTVAGPSGPVTVNRYILQRETAQALVLYWYQGRGRVEADEYRVKWHLLRDAALRQRSDEALVRIVVPMRGNEAEALALAEHVASSLLPAVARALPD